MLLICVSCVGSAAARHRRRRLGLLGGHTRASMPSRCPAHGAGRARGVAKPARRVVNSCANTSLSMRGARTSDRDTARTRQLCTMARPGVCGSSEKCLTGVCRRFLHAACRFHDEAPCTASLTPSGPRHGGRWQPRCTHSLAAASSRPHDGPPAANHVVAARVQRSPHRRHVVAAAGAGCWPRWSAVMTKTTCLPRPARPPRCPPSCPALVAAMRA